MAEQLALNLRLRDASSFDNFLATPNQEAVACLRGLLREEHAAHDPRSLFLWGEAGSGKTHLLEGACRSVQAQGATPFYLPLADATLRPRVLEAAELSYLICLDDVHCVAGDAAWEAALFALYELGRTTGVRLLASATAAPTRLGFKMPELATRLAWGPVYQLRALDDAQKLEAIRLRGANRGFDLSPEVLRYILHRYPRDLHSLFALLDRIDSAALAHQRRITIPFLRQLEQSGSAT